MDQPVATGEAVRDDVAELKRLPLRRSTASQAPSTAPLVATRSRFVAWALIAVALALLCVLSPLSVIGDVARAFMYAGTLAAVGIGVFALVVHDRAGSPRETLALRELTLIAALVAVVASVVGLGIQIAAISGRGLAGVTDGEAAGIVAGNGYCGSVMIRIAGLGLIGFAAYYASDAWTAGFFGGFGAAMSCVWCVLTGHEATHGFPVQFAVVLHMLAASVWLGGLVALGITLRDRRRESDLVGGAVVVKRFSILMSSTVAVLIAAGITLTWLLVGSVGRLVTTNYGLVLSAKIALAFVVIVVAGFNQRRLVPSVVEQSERGWHLLARTVLFEQAALLAVVALTAVLVSLDPGS